MESWEIVSLPRELGVSGNRRVWKLQQRMRGPSPGPEGASTEEGWEDSSVLGTAGAQGKAQS